MGIVANALEQLANKEKAQLLDALIKIYLILMSSILVFRQIIEQNRLISPTSFYVLYVLLIGSFVALKKYKSVKWAARLLSVIFFVIIPFRVYFTGGINSSAIFAYFTHTTMAYAVYGKKIGIFVFIFNFISICVFLFIKTPPLVEPELLSYAFVKIIVLGTVIIPFFIIIDQTEFMVKKYVRKEREWARFVVLRRINHELGNSINIAMGYLQMSMNSYREDYLSKVKTSLEDILEVLDKMDEAKDKMDIVNFLSERDRKVKILEEFKNAEFSKVK